jgi:dTDP-4-dehydrorhamnose 3,5-epimerase
MNFIPQHIEGVVLINADVHVDDRGSFRRTFCAEEMKMAGINIVACQGNISENTKKYTMRGFHYQKGPSSEAKLITPISGRIYNVLIDLRPSSKTYLKSFAKELNSTLKESIYVPAGCANAFLTLDDNTNVHYYMGDFFKPESYCGFKYNDPYFNIFWPHPVKVISDKDKTFPDFSVQDL